MELAAVVMVVDIVGVVIVAMAAAVEFLKAVVDFHCVLVVFYQNYPYVCSFLP